MADFRPDEVSKFRALLHSEDKWKTLSELDAATLRRYRKFLEVEHGATTKGFFLRAMNGAADVVESLWNMNYWKKTEDVARFVAKQREMDEQAALNYVHKARAWAKANPRAALALGALVGVKLIPWSDEVVIIALTGTTIGLGYKYAMPAVLDNFSQMRSAIKAEMLQGRAQLDVIKHSMDTHIRASNELARVVAAPRPMTWSPPPRASFSLLDFTKRFVAVQRDAYAFVKQPPSWSWYVRQGNEVPLPK